jgi:hypothetical protein
MTTTDDNTAPSFSEHYEATLEKFRALAAIAHLLSNDDNLDDVIRDAASHAWTVAHEGVKRMEALWERHGEEYERKPHADDSPAEWTGATAEAEVRALMPRIFALPEYSVRQLMDFCLTVVTAHNAEKPSTVTLEEIASMLERGATASSVQSFWHLKHNGLAQLTENKPADEQGSAV